MNINQANDQEDETVLDYCNYQTDHVTTLIKVAELRKLLFETHYDADKTKYIVSGFSQGFEIGYQGPMERTDLFDNIPLHRGNKVILWNKVMKEVKLGRYAGPFSKPPFKHYIQSPIGLVPKDKGRKTRLIFHLSFDFGSEENQKSVNYHIPESKCTVKYRDLDHAIKNSLKLMDQLGLFEKRQPIFYSKTNLESAFRAVPLRLQDHWLLMMAAFHSVTGKKYYFYDLCLPFGAGSSCQIYQAFSNCLHHIVEYKIGQWNCTNYLDDLCFYAETEEICN